MNFLRDFWLLSLLVVAGSSVASAQFLNWEYTGLVSDLNQSGANPRSVTDSAGQLHVCYWHEADNQLVYGTKTSGNWNWEHPDAQTEAGYVSDLCLDAQGNVHIAYLARTTGGQAWLKYAVKKNGTWTTESVFSDSVLGVYGPDPDFRSFLHLSVSIRLGTDGQPVIAVFDGSVPGFSSCTYPLGTANYSPAGKYDLQMRILRRSTSGNWTAFSPNLPATLSCLSRGDRFGEFCHILSVGADSMLVLTSALHNHESLLMQFDPDTLNQWKAFVIDSAGRFPLAPAAAHNGHFEGYGYLDYATGGDSVLHTIATFSRKYEESFYSRNRLIYSKIRLDSLWAPGYHATVTELAVNDSYLRTYGSIAVLSPDSIRVVYFNTQTSRLEMGASNNGGATWSYTPVVSTLTNTQVQLHVTTDSLLLVWYDLAQDKLFQAGLPRKGSGSWRIHAVTLSQSSGKYLASQISRDNNGDSLFVSWVEDREQQLWFQSGDLLTRQQERVDTAGANAREHSLARLASGMPVLAYATHNPSQLRVATRSGSEWTTEVIDPSAVIRRLRLCVAGDTLHVLYYETGLQGVKHAWKAPGQGWVIQIADSAGDQVGEHLNALVSEGRLLVSYLDEAAQTLKLATWNAASGWSFEVVASTQKPTLHALATDSLGNPRIAWLGSDDGLLRYSEKNGTNWNTVTLPLQSGFHTEPVRMIIDGKNRPWVFFNLTTSTDDIKILRLDENGAWQPVGVNNNSVEIANSFDVHLVGKDLYIIGKQNNPLASGIGVLYAPEGITTWLDADLLAAAADIVPNPSAAEALVRMQLPLDGPVQVQVWNLTGQVLSQAEGYGVAGETLEIPLKRPQSAGYYLCRISCGGVEVVKKWVVLE